MVNNSYNITRSTRACEHARFTPLTVGRRRYARKVILKDKYRLNLRYSKALLLVQGSCKPSSSDVNSKRAWGRAGGGNRYLGRKCGASIFTHAYKYHSVDIFATQNTTLTPPSPFRDPPSHLYTKTDVGDVEVNCDDCAQHDETADGVLHENDASAPIGLVAVTPGQ